MLIELSRLHADPRNSNVCTPDVLEKIERNIQRSGQCPSLIVRPHPEKPDEYILIDGHHRYRILQNLGWTSVECQVWSVDEKEAALLLATLNRLRGTDNFHKRAELLQELTTTFSFEDLSHLVPESSKQIEDMMALLSLNLETAQEAFQRQIDAEAAILPVPLTFMVRADEVDLIDQALALTGSQDRGAALAALCRKALEEGQAGEEHHGG